MKMKTLSTHAVTRRRFLQTAAAVSVGLTLPRVRGRAATIGEGVREGVRVGVIAVGNQGKPLMLQNFKNVVAVCDVDQERLAAARKEIVDRTGRECPAYTDYRKLLENRDVDAVIIATPDHWHALQTVHAIEAGKHVYVEKPLSLVLDEGRLMVETARKHKKIVQVGSMQRSDRRFRQACELVRSGRIGKVHTVRVGLPAVNYSAGVVPDSAPPPELDYELWLGPAPWHPYNKNRVHYNFRFFWDYSGGQMTNWGAHHLDIAQWGLDMDNSGPVEIQGKAVYDEKKEYEVFRETEIVYTYANGVNVYCSQGPNRKNGTQFEGDKGRIYVDRGKLESDPAGIVQEPLKDADVKLYHSDNHHTDWYQCIKSGQWPICDVEIGHRSAAVCHLGNIASRLGRKIRWDPVKEQIVGDAEAAQMQRYAYRAPWKLPGF
jgi:predicted dehydrogenase